MGVAGVMTMNAKIVNISNIVGGNCFIFKSAFEGSECDAFLSPILSCFVSANDMYPDSYRNNERYWEDNDVLADSLFKKTKQLCGGNNEIKKSVEGFCSLNSRLRFCKYSTGQVFNVHRDGVYHKSDNEKSSMTFLLYLNDDYEGGETKFYKNKCDKIPSYTYKAKKGDLLIFNHDIWHEGSAVQSGEKYILRSDLIFKKRGGITLVNHSHKGYIWDVLNYQGAIYSAGRDKKIKKWNYDLFKLAENEVHESSVLALEGVANHIYSVSRDGRFSKLTTDLKLVNKVDSRHASPVGISVTDLALITTGSDGYIRMWDLDLNMKGEVKAHEGWSWRCAARDEDTLVSIGSDGYFKVWDSRNLECIRSVNLLHGSLRCCVVLGGFVYIGCENGSILKVCSKFLIIENVYKVHDGIVRDVVANGAHMYSCGEDGRIVKTHIVKNSQETIVKYEDFVSSISFNEENKGYSSGYDGVIGYY